MANITKQLQYELKKNPKKAGLLALLLAVGLYFWAPLIGGWIGPKDSVAESTTNSKASKPSPPGSATATTTPQAKQTTARTNWRKLADWLDGDRRAQANRGLPGGRNPFAMSKALVARLEKIKDDEKSLEAPQVEQPTLPQKITPESVGLVLSSILYGKRQRIAMFNAGVYREGEFVEVEMSGVRVQGSGLGVQRSPRSPNPERRTVAFRLAEVHPRFVILTYKNQPFRMELPSDRLSGAKRIRRVRPAEKP